MHIAFRDGIGVEQAIRVIRRYRALAMQQAVVQCYGERGVAELTGLIGAYTTTWGATAVDNFSPVEGSAPRLEPLT